MPTSQGQEIITVQHHILQLQQEHPTTTGEFSRILSAITLSTKIIASYVNRAGLLDLWGETGHRNVQDEDAQKLDVLANETLKRTLGMRRNVGIVASEEDADPRVLQEIEQGGEYIVMFDPLDGSSNIDTNVSVGTIFAIFRNPSQVQGVEKSVLQPGRKQVAAGYVVYGSSTVLVCTTGHGVHMFTLDPQIGAFLLTREHIRMPAHAKHYSVNEAYANIMPPGYRRYLNWVKREENGPYSSRYIGSLVADFHRILIKGGVFLYPETADKTEGKLRLMYEADPLAFIAEQAGGAATDGSTPILEKQPQSLHERTPLIIGSLKNVDEVLRLIKEPLPAETAAARSEG